VLLDRKELLCGRAITKESASSGTLAVKTAEDLLPAFIGKEQFPPDSPVIPFRTGGAGGVIFRPLPFPLMNVPATHVA